MTCEIKIVPQKPAESYWEKTKLVPDGDRYYNIMLIFEHCSSYIQSSLVHYVILFQQSSITHKMALRKCFTVFFPLCFKFMIHIILHKKQDLVFLMRGNIFTEEKLFMCPKPDTNVRPSLTKLRFATNSLVSRRVILLNFDAALPFFWLFVRNLIMNSKSWLFPA